MKKIYFVYYIIIFICPLSNIQAYSQEKIKYWKESDCLIQDQAAILFENATNVLRLYPPSPEVSTERKLALLSLDAILHDQRLDNGLAFKKYMHNTFTNMSKELKNNKYKSSETKIFQFYNHGYIIQSEGITIAIDLVRHGKENEPFICDTTMQSIIDECDILFISHAHSDHADRTVAEMFTDKGKKVISPEKIWEDIGPNLIVLRYEEMKNKNFNINNTILSTHIFPGHQGDVKNNVYIFTLKNGQTIMHTGDQDYSEELIQNINKIKGKIDVLLVHCWLMPMDKFVNGINPSLVITGHHNEMRHSIDHRESYWLTFRRLSQVDSPYIVTAWGESVPLNKK